MISLLGGRIDSWLNAVVDRIADESMGWRDGRSMVSVDA